MPDPSVSPTPQVVQAILGMRRDGKDRIILDLPAGVWMRWTDETILHEFIDNGKECDAIVRGILANVREEDPHFVHLEAVGERTYRRAALARVVP